MGGAGGGNPPSHEYLIIDYGGKKEFLRWTHFDVLLTTFNRHSWHTWHYKVMRTQKAFLEYV